MSDILIGLNGGPLDKRGIWISWTLFDTISDLYATMTVVRVAGHHYRILKDAGFTSIQERVSVDNCLQAYHYAEPLPPKTQVLVIQKPVFYETGVAVGEVPAVTEDGPGVGKVRKKVARPEGLWRAAEDLHTGDVILHRNRFWHIISVVGFEGSEALVVVAAGLASRYDFGVWKSPRGYKYNITKVAPINRADLDLTEEEIRQHYDGVAAPDTKKS